MEKFQFNSNNSYEAGVEVVFGYCLDSDGDVMSYMGIKERPRDPGRRFYYEVEVLESEYIGRWGSVRACTKCRIITKEENNER